MLRAPVRLQQLLPQRRRQLPPSEAIQEVQVLANNYGAEYARNARAIFSAVSRGRINKFHGAFWEVAKNTAFNANNYLTGKLSNKGIQNQYGATFGGPILHDKLFSFAAYQGYRLAQGGTATATIFTSVQFKDANTDGTFSASTKDALTGKVFAGGIIPHQRFDPTQ